MADNEKKPRFGRAIVQEFVGVRTVISIGVKELLEGEPALVNPPGIGVAALGGRSRPRSAHGRPDIAEYLLARGAALGLFARGDARQVEVVRATLAHFSGSAQSSRSAWHSADRSRQSRRRLRCRRVLGISGVNARLQHRRHEICCALSKGPAVCLVRNKLCPGSSCSARRMTMNASRTLSLVGFVFLLVLCPGARSAIFP